MARNASDRLKLRGGTLVNPDHEGGGKKRGEEYGGLYFEMPPIFVTRRTFNLLRSETDDFRPLKCHTAILSFCRKLRESGLHELPPSPWLHTLGNEEEHEIRWQVLDEDTLRKLKLTGFNNFDDEFQPGVSDPIILHYKWEDDNYEENMFPYPDDVIRARLLPTGLILSFGKSGFSKLRSDYYRRQIAEVRLVPEQNKLLDLVNLSEMPALNVTGRPGTGKTTVAHFSIPEIALVPSVKDRICSECGRTLRKGRCEVHRDLPQGKKILYLTTTTALKEEALAEIKSALRYVYCVNEAWVDRVLRRLRICDRDDLTRGVVNFETTSRLTPQSLKLLLKKDREYRRDNREKNRWAYDQNITLLRGFINNVVFGVFGSVQDYLKWSKRLKHNDPEWINKFSAPIDLFQPLNDEGPRHQISIADLWDMPGEGKKQWVEDANELLERIEKGLVSEERDGLWTHDALVGIVSDMDEAPNEIWKGRYDAVIIDEIQDFGPISVARILRKLTNRGAKGPGSNMDPLLIYVAGDEMQTIEGTLFIPNNIHINAVYDDWIRHLKRISTTSLPFDRGLDDIVKHELKRNHRNSDQIVMHALIPITKEMQKLANAMATRPSQLARTFSMPKKGGSKRLGAVITRSKKKAGELFKEAMPEAVVNRVSHQLDDAGRAGIFEKMTATIIIPDNEYYKDEGGEADWEGVELFLKGYGLESVAEKTRAAREYVLENYHGESGAVERFISLNGGICTVRHLKGLTVEGAIVLGFNDAYRESSKKGTERTRLLDLSHMLVAVSRPQNLLIMVDDSDYDGLVTDSKKFIGEVAELEELLARTELNVDPEEQLGICLDQPYLTTNWTILKKAVDMLIDGDPAKTEELEGFKVIIETISSVFENHAKKEFTVALDKLTELQEKNAYQTYGGLMGPHKGLLEPKLLEEARQMVWWQSYIKGGSGVSSTLLLGGDRDEGVDIGIGDWHRLLEEVDEEAAHELAGEILDSSLGFDHVKFGYHPFSTTLSWTKLARWNKSITAKVSLSDENKWFFKEDPNEQNPFDVNYQMTIPGEWTVPTREILERLGRLKGGKEGNVLCLRWMVATSSRDPISDWKVIWEIIEKLDDSWKRKCASWIIDRNIAKDDSEWSDFIKRSYYDDGKKSDIVELLSMHLENKPTDEWYSEFRRLDELFERERTKGTIARNLLSEPKQVKKVYDWEINIMQDIVKKKLDFDNQTIGNQLNRIRRNSAGLKGSPKLLLELIHDLRKGAIDGRIDQIRDNFLSKLTPSQLDEHEHLAGYASRAMDHAWGMLEGRKQSFWPKHKDSVTLLEHMISLKEADSGGLLSRQIEMLCSSKMRREVGELYHSFHSKPKHADKILRGSLLDALYRAVKKSGEPGRFKITESLAGDLGIGETHSHIIHQKKPNAMLQNPPYLITPVSGAGVIDEAYSRVPPASTTEIEKSGVEVGSFGLNRSGVNSLIDLHMKGVCEQRRLRRSGHYREAGLLSLATSISKISRGAEDDGLLKRGMIDLLESRAGVYIDHVQSVKHRGRQSTSWADRKLKYDRRKRGSGDEFVIDRKKKRSILKGKRWKQSSRDEQPSDGNRPLFHLVSDDSALKPWSPSPFNENHRDCLPLLRWDVHQDAYNYDDGDSLMERRALAGEYLWQTKSICRATEELLPYLLLLEEVKSGMRVEKVEWYDLSEDNWPIPDDPVKYHKQTVPTVDHSREELLARLEESGDLWMAELVEAFLKGDGKDDLSERLSVLLDKIVSDEIPGELASTVLEATR